MPVIIKPTSEIIVDLGIQENGPAHAYLTHQCRLHMDKYVPYSGSYKNPIHLRENVAETTDAIIYMAPYAHAQYVGYTTGPVVNYTTPGTGPYWDKLMWTAEGSEVIKDVQNYINLRGGK